MTTTTRWNDVAARVKTLEEVNDGRVPKEKGFIVRLDGVAFHTFTKGMTRPFDPRMCDAMLLTCESLLKKFHCLTAYTQSDEITLWFPPQPEPGQAHLYGGRVQKLCSIIAAYTSVVFAQHMKHESRVPFFDARILVPETDEDIVACFTWRQWDCRRNAISTIANSKFSAREMLHKSRGQLEDMLLSKGVILRDGRFTPHNLYGTFLKKYNVEVQAINRRTQEMEMCTRTAIFRNSMQDSITLEFIQARRYEHII